jgi:autotransporter-associated beta strand protein
MNRCFTMAIMAILTLASGAARAQETWIGGGGDNLLSNTGNWQDGILPDTADANQLIYFDSATHLAPSNDYLTSVGELRFQSGAGAMTLSGNQVTVGRTSDSSNNAMVSLSTATQTVDLDIILRGHASNKQNRNFYVGTDGTLIIDGVISSLSATPELTKTAAGTLILNGANTYNSGTRVNGGSLFVNNTTGSGTGSGGVIVARDAAIILGGNGAIAGSLNMSGVLQPGATGNGDIGTFTVNDDVNWVGDDGIKGVTWDFDLGTAAASLASAVGGGSTQDRLTIVGNFTKDTTFGTDFHFDFQGGGDKGWYKLVDWTGTTGFESDDFTATNLDAGYSGEFTIDSDALYLEVIPEPSTLSLLAVMFGAAIFMRRRR